MATELLSVRVDCLHWKHCSNDQKCTVSPAASQKLGDEGVAASQSFLVIIRAEQVKMGRSKTRSQ